MLSHLGPVELAKFNKHFTKLAVLGQFLHQCLELTFQIFNEHHLLEELVVRL
jgi:hypothetical protein